jgi:hypothetical protein
MKILFSKIWKYLAFLFAGIAAGMVAAIKLIEKPAVLNIATDTFVAEQNQKIGKIKQRGEGNSLDTSLLSEIQTRREKRLARRSARRKLRLAKETKMEEQDLKYP